MLESFRESLIIYLSKARPVVDEVGADVARTRLWLQTDQRLHWEGEVRRRARKLQEAQQALFSARLCSLRDVRAAEQIAVEKAKKDLQFAEEKLKLLKKWNRDFGSRVEPLIKQLGRLHTVLSYDMPKAIAHLAQVVKTLDEYASVAPPSATKELPPPKAGAAPGGAAPRPGEPKPSETEPAGQTVRSEK